MSLIADVRINNQYIRVINNHFETTSANAYRGIITAPGKSLKVRAKAVKDLVLKMKNNYLKRAEQADSIHAEIERSPYPVLVRLQRYARFLYVPSVTERSDRWFP